jgi:transposase
MSLQPENLPEIPEDTARIARTLFPKGNRYMWLRDELGAIYSDEQFASLYPKTGQLAEQPWRLAVMSIIQYMENYTDRQVAEAVKTRIDLKYALSLELTDPGCDFSVRSRIPQSLDQRQLGRSSPHDVAHYLSRAWLVEGTREAADRFDPY